MNFCDEITPFSNVCREHRYVWETHQLQWWCVCGMKRTILFIWKQARPRWNCVDTAVRGERREDGVRISTGKQVKMSLLSVHTWGPRGPGKIYWKSGKRVKMIWGGFWRGWIYGKRTRDACWKKDLKCFVWNRKVDEQIEKWDFPEIGYAKSSFSKKVIRKKSFKLEIFQEKQLSFNAEEIFFVTIL